MKFNFESLHISLKKKNKKKENSTTYLYQNRNQHFRLNEFFFSFLELVISAYRLGIEFSEYLLLFFFKE